MSLLIKALDKAQEAKAQEAEEQDARIQDRKARDANADSAKRKPHVLDNDESQPAESLTAAKKLAASNALEMELSPISQVDRNAPQSYGAKMQNNPEVFEIASTFKLQQPASTQSASKENKSIKANKTSSAAQASPVNKDSAGAANVFAAKQLESNSPNAILALIAAISLCLLLAAGGYYYLFMDDEPDFVLAKRAELLPTPLPANPSATTQILAEPQQNVQSVKLADSPVQSDIAPKPETTSPIALNEVASPQAAKAENSINKAAKTSVFTDKSLAQNEVVLSDMQVEKTSVEKTILPARNASRTLEGGAIASKSASIQVSRNQAVLGVNPILMDAFNAYNAGNDAVASKLYRQVLQRDVRNVDALLGLGAIAQRQGRIADANGWYAKVLEVEPRNTLANAAILENQPQNDVANNESRIKNMLAKYPDDANLHATLGNFYADLNQWPAAQQAYFDAYRLNASADNAFNLAVSLDQLGKPKLALPYYQSALQLAQTGGSNIDKTALEARIAAIQ